MKLFVLIYILEFVFLVRANKCQENSHDSLITILNESYMLRIIKTFDGKPPQELRYEYGDIFYKVDNDTFALRKDSNREIFMKYRVVFDKRKSYVNNVGNKVFTEDKSMYMFERNSRKKFRIIPRNGHKIDQLNVDVNKDRVFFIGYDINFSKTNPTTGRLYAFDMKNPNKVGSKIEVADIKQLDNKVASIKVDKTSGKSIIAMEISENKWALYKLENMYMSNCKLHTKQVNHTNALEAAIALAGEQILKLYEEAILGHESSEILKRRKIIQFPNGGSQKQYFGSQTNIAYDPLAAVDYDACGSQLDSMTKKIEKLKTEMKNLNERFDRFYSNVFTPKIERGLNEFNEYFKVYTPLKPMKMTDVPKDDSKKYVCAIEDDLQSKVNDFIKATSHLSLVSKWLESVTDMMNRDDLRTRNMNNGLIVTPPGT